MCIRVELELFVCLREVNLNFRQWKSKVQYEVCNVSKDNFVLFIPYFALFYLAFSSP